MTEIGCVILAKAGIHACFVILAKAGIHSCFVILAKAGIHSCFVILAKAGIHAPAFQRTGLLSAPMPSISMRSTSPDLRYLGGLKPMPTPTGVPVAMTSPG